MAVHCQQQGLHEHDMAALLCRADTSANRPPPPYIFKDTETHLLISPIAPAAECTQGPTEGLGWIGRDLPCKPSE